MNELLRAAAALPFGHLVLLASLLYLGMLAALAAVADRAHHPIPPTVLLRMSAPVLAGAAVIAAAYCVGALLDLVVATVTGLLSVLS
ncbi:hypothetical protein ACIA8O_38840 [Kitasatospora sp. NPDC051853]|uniref:hypothetical protein n=1 Tax=Kitasatospora sp. NPDC051853 TaxID=3364058 RepID=UPI0037AFA23E